MKKLLFAMLLGLISVPTLAAETEVQGTCAYTTRQWLIQTARSQEQIQNLINKNVSFQEETKCGGSLLQLAVRRGNPGVFAAILNQDLSRANNKEKLDAFPIPGVWGEIPILLFAAYYAPNEDIVRLLVNAQADIAATDNQGRNVLWYMKQNPVLRDTALYDELNERLLVGLAEEPEPKKEAVEVKKQRPVTNNASKLVFE